MESLLKKAGPIAVDARMIHNSGIGVVLREILCIWAQQDIPKITLYGDPEKIEISLPEGLNAEIRSWKRPIYSPDSLFLGPRLPRKIRAWFSPHYSTFMFPRRPLIAGIHDVLHITHPPRAGTASYMRLCLALLRHRAAYIVTPSRHVKVQLQTLHGFQPHRVLTAPNGPGPVARVRPEKRRMPEALNGADYMMSVGIFKPHKNWDFLMRELSLANGRWPKLICLGLGADREKLAALARQFGVEDRVQILDYLEPEELAEVYHRARVYIHQSVAEGFGLPILEAMHCGAPVVCADRSPMKETTAGTAFTFEPDWSESFHHAVETAIQAREKAPEQLERAKKLAAKYSWKQTTRRIEEAILRAVGDQ